MYLINHVKRAPTHQDYKHLIATADSRLFREDLTSGKREFQGIYDDLRLPTVPGHARDKSL
jgi:hypothetical protein